MPASERRLRIIANPTAGAGKAARVLAEVESRLRGLGFAFDRDLTAAPGHATEIARSAALKGDEWIVAVGGDGTINEIVNGLHQSGRMSEVKLGIIGAGTGCDCLRSLGIPRGLDEACLRFTRPAIRVIDVGVADYRHDGSPARRLFVNNAGIGLDAEVARNMTKKRGLLRGSAYYFASALKAMLSHQNRDISLKINGHSGRRRVCMIIASNLNYMGGGMRIAPDADPEDGLIDVTIIGAMNKAELLWSFPRVYKGNHTSLSRVTVEKCQEVEVTSGDGTFVEVDGDFVGTPPARFSVLPGQLNVII